MHLPGPPAREIFEEYLSAKRGIPEFPQQAWQMRQLLNAVRWAHGELLKEAWVDEVEWEALGLEYADLNEDAHEAVGDAVGLEELVMRYRGKGLSEGRARSVARLVEVLRSRHYAFRTEITYREWVVRLLLKTGPLNDELPSEAEARLFLSDLAVK